jgi:hypothetical protein
MAVNPRQELHDLVDRLSEDEARRFIDVLRQRASRNGVQGPRPLIEADILLAEPVLPEDETADEMIATVRRWRCEGGYA